MKKDEDKLLDVTTEVGRRYALLIRTSDTHNLHNYLPFALVASFFTQRCYDYIVYYRDPLHRRGHLPQQKLQSNEDEDELFMTYSQAGSSLANSRTNSMYQQQTQQSFDEDFFIPSLEREDANAFSDLLPEQEQNLVDIYQAALEEASLASPPPASHFAAIRPNKTNLSTSTFPRNQTSKQSYSPPDGPRPAKFHPTPAPFGKQNSIESVPDDISAMYMSSTNTSPSLSPAPSFLGYRSNSVNTVMSYQSRFSLDHSPSSNN